jgi:hypothetical protein
MGDWTHHSAHWRVGQHGGVLVCSDIDHCTAGRRWAARKSCHCHSNALSCTLILCMHSGQHRLPSIVRSSLPPCGNSLSCVSLTIVCALVAGPPPCVFILVVLHPHPLHVARKARCKAGVCACVNVKCPTRDTRHPHALLIVHARAACACLSHDYNLARVASASTLTRFVASTQHPRRCFWESRFVHVTCLGHCLPVGVLRWWPCGHHPTHSR